MTGLRSLTASWTALLLLSLVLLLSLSITTAEEDFYGYVRFFDGPKFTGESYYFYTSDSQYCINLNCFDDKATSVDWEDLPIKGTVDDDWKAKIAFFTGWDCTGTKREWSIMDLEYPRDLSIDGIDNDISSFIIYETSRESKGNILPCPRNFELF